MGLNEESAKLKNSLKKIIKECIKEEEKSCLRLYKAVVKTVPDGSTCGVQVLGDTKTINLKYATAVSGVNVDDFVWVSTLYNSFSNAIVFATIDFRWNGYKRGDIYISLNNTSPAQLFGGSWEQIQGQFLLSANSNFETVATPNYNGATNGGEAATSHYHWQSVGADLGLSGGDTIYFNRNNVASTRVLENIQRALIINDTTSGVGNARQDSTSSETINNMPPYLVVYMWRKIG